MDSDGMSKDQLDKVLHFQEITAIDDLNAIKERLIRNNWNLEIAYQEYHNLKEGIPSSAQSEYFVLLPACASPQSQL
jgi:hypothetical protein